MAIRKSSSSGIPFGNTAGRPANPNSGQPYFNGETQRLELMTSNGSWENIVQEVPGVSSISGQYVETNNSNTITVYGTNFVSGATVYAIGTNAVQVPATSTTFNSLVQLTAVFTGLTSANEPYDIKVVNPSNLFGILPDALYVNNQVAWTTPAGSIGSFGDEVAISVSAVATDDSTITYAVASGSSLPSGISLNTATGLISGTLPNVSSNTTYTFTLTASDGSNPAVSREFSFTSNAAPVWTTSSGSLGTFNELSSISLTVAATDVSDTVTYELASGSSLPSGITLNSSTGVISGTLPDINTNTTYTFTINASDGINAVPRTFSITSNYTISIEYLVVGGGGGSGTQRRGGGGAGGMLTGTSGFSPGSTLLVTVGNGGPATTTQSVKPNGENSVLGSLIAYGGGGGAGDNGGTEVANGAAGGSGGGGLGDAAPYGLGGAGTTGQGNNGGSGQGSLDPHYGAGGGGGAGAVGGNGTSSGPGGNGGNGIQSSITGTATYYAGGGGGGYYNNTSGARSSGGLGGGGRGGANGIDGESGTPNTGGGGGGGFNGSGGTRNGGSGGSGVVIIAYPNTFPAISNIPVGLTYDQPTRSGYRVYRFTAGTGTITL